MGQIVRACYVVVCVHNQTHGLDFKRFSLKALNPTMADTYNVTGAGRAQVARFAQESLTTARVADWSTILADVSPYSWGSMGIGLGLGLSILGAAWCGCHGLCAPSS